MRARRELEPGQLGEVGAAGELTVRTVNASAYTAWTQGRVAFDDIPVSEVLADLSRWFDLDMSTPDPSLAARHVVLAFTQERADAVLRGLATMVGAHLVQHGHAIQLIPDQSAPSARTP
jgi:transmembrane sensor